MRRPPHAFNIGVTREASLTGGLRQRHFLRGSFQPPLPLRSSPPSFQAYNENDIASARRLSSKLRFGDYTNYFFLSESQIWVALPDTARLRELAKNLELSANIFWGHNADCVKRLSLVDAFVFRNACVYDMYFLSHGLPLV